jgi:hypothetical protein
MDDNTRQLLVALLSGLFGLFTGVAVAALGLRHARDLDEDRFRRETSTRWLGERRQAYSKLLLTLDEHHHRVAARFDDIEAEADDPRTPGMLGSADGAYEDVQIIGSPKVRAAAASLYGTLIVLDTLTRTRPLDAVTFEYAMEVRARLIDEWVAVRRAIHDDLGIEPDPPTDPETGLEIPDDRPDS